MLVTKYKVELTLTEPMLGTVPKSDTVFADFLAQKALKRREEAGTITTDAAAALIAEEAETLPSDPEERGWTGFHTDEKGPHLYDYQIKGFMKEAGNLLKDFPGVEVKQLRDKIDNYLFIRPRRIYLGAIEAEPLERPLRAMTMQGPRVSLVRSDKIAAGSIIEFELWVLPFVLKGREIFTKELLTFLLEYGELKGLGQWRNGGFGGFTASIAPM